MTHEVSDVYSCGWLRRIERVVDEIALEIERRHSLTITIQERMGVSAALHVMMLFALNNIMVEYQDQSDPGSADAYMKDEEGNEAGVHFKVYHPGHLIECPLAAEAHPDANYTVIVVAKEAERKFIVAGYVTPDDNQVRPIMLSEGKVFGRDWMPPDKELRAGAAVAATEDPLGLFS